RVLDGGEREALVRALGSEAAGAAWRRAIVERCIEEPAGTGIAALYALAIEVNPELDLRALRPRANDAGGAGAERRRAPRDEGAEFRARLRSLAHDARARLAHR